MFNNIGEYIICSVKEKINVQIFLNKIKNKKYIYTKKKRCQEVHPNVTDIIYGSS